jgi:hypothetical protein
MPEDVGILAPGFLQSVGENGQAGIVQLSRGKKPIIVGGLCEVQHGGRHPGGSNGDGAEGVAEDVTEQ